MVTPSMGTIQIPTIRTAFFFCGNSDRATRNVAQTLGTNHTRMTTRTLFIALGHRIYGVRFSLGSGEALRRTQRWITKAADSACVRPRRTRSNTDDERSVHRYADESRRGVHAHRAAGVSGGALQILRLMPLTLSRGWRRVDSRLSTRRLFDSVLFETCGPAGFTRPICIFSHCTGRNLCLVLRCDGQKTWLALMWRSNHFVLFSAGNSENSVTSARNTRCSIRPEGGSCEGTGCARTSTQRERARVRRGQECGQ